MSSGAILRCDPPARPSRACAPSTTTAAAACAYVEQRGRAGATIERWLLGFAPPEGEWLVRRAREDAVSREMLEKVGLIARRQSGPGCYDRFRDRVQFPIRDARGQVVG